MQSKSAILFVATLCMLAQNISAFSPRLKHTQQQCEIICNKSGGKAVFDDKTSICKCSLAKNVDDADISLIYKNAEVMGVQLESVKASGPSLVIIKREIHHENNNNKDETKTAEEKSENSHQAVETVEAEPKDTTSDDSKTIVGQGSPFTKKLQQRIVGQRRRELRPITQEQQRLIVQQMRDHLNRLDQTHDQRARQFEIEALKNNVRQLSQTSIPAPATTPRPLVPQPRSRLRNVVEEVRKRQNSRRVNPMNRVVGAAHKDDTEKHGGEHHADAHPKHHPHQHEIITQDPRLIDD